MFTRWWSPAQRRADVAPARCLKHGLGAGVLGRRGGIVGVGPPRGLLREELAQLELAKAGQSQVEALELQFSQLEL